MKQHWSLFACAVLALLVVSLPCCTQARKEWFYVRPNRTTESKLVSFAEIYTEEYKLLGYLEHRSTIYKGLRDYADEYFIYNDQFSPVGLIDEKGCTYIFDRTGDLKRLGDFEIQTGTLRILGYTGKAVFSRGLE